MIGNVLLRNNPLVLVDVGASGGLDPRWSRFTSEYRAILFEPDPREFQRLKEHSAANLVVLQAALADSPRMLELNLCVKQKLSSLYVPNFEYLKKFRKVERFDIARTVRLEADTLRNQLRLNGTPDVDFMKLDTQGSELMILKGSGEYLDAAVGVEVEVEFSAVYTGQPLFGEVDAFAREQGFELFDMRKRFWRLHGCPKRNVSPGQLAFADALYLRAPENLLGAGQVPEDKIIRAFCVYLAYERDDLARLLINEATSRGMLSAANQALTASVLARFRKRRFLGRFIGNYKVDRSF